MMFSDLAWTSEQSERFQAEFCPLEKPPNRCETTVCAEKNETFGDTQDSPLPNAL